MEQQSRLRIFTWHVHGSYLFYLSQGDYDIFIPVKDAKTEGYYGRGNQRNLPKIYLEHDPPWGHPRNTKHPVTDPAILLVNQVLLFWGTGITLWFFAKGGSYRKISRRKGVYILVIP